METKTFKKLCEIARKPNINAVIMQGSTSSGKTYSALELIILLMTQEKPGSICSIVAESLPNLRKGGMRDFFNILLSKGIYQPKQHNKTNFSYTFPGAGTVEFFGADNEESMKNGKRDYLFVNEATGVAFPSFEQLFIRTKKKTFIDFNPSSRFWAHDFVEEYPDTSELFISTYKDNCFLEKSMIEKIEARKPVYDEEGNLLRGKPNWWRVYGEGLIGSHDGLIYKEGENWQLSNHEPKIEELSAVGIDWGFSNDETAIVGLWRYERGFFVKTLCYQLGMLPDDYKPKMEAIGIPKTVPLFADSASPMMIEKVKKDGWFSIFPSLKYAGSLKDGISLCQNNMLYFAKNDSIYPEILEFEWKKDKNGNQTDTPEKEGHSLAAMRYGIEGMNKPKRESVAPIFF